MGGIGVWLLYVRMGEIGVWLLYVRVDTCELYLGRYECLHNDEVCCDQESDDTRAQVVNDFVVVEVRRGVRKGHIDVGCRGYARPTPPMSCACRE